MRSKIANDYSRWLIGLACDWCEEFGPCECLINYLHSVPFRSSIENDRNRAADGCDLRIEFANDSSNYTIRDVMLYMDKIPCSMLEMMVALAGRCEGHIMGDPEIGDRSGVWFCNMLANMHLEQMTDDNYDEAYISSVVNNVLDRKYRKNGDGGLFSIRDKNLDMRKAEIWYQMNWYLSEITNS